MIRRKKTMISIITDTTTTVTMRNDGLQYYSCNFSVKGEKS